MGPVGEEVERVAEQDGLQVGDRLHPGDVAHDLRLLHDQASVGDGEAVQEVHQDDDDEEDKGDEEGEGEPGQLGLRVDGDVGEFELADKHGDCFHKTCPGSVKVDVVVVASFESREILSVLY